MKRYRAIARYYDAENARHEMLQNDVPFFLGQLPRRKSLDILEIAVGTARAAIPIAQAGHRVVGIDYAKDMLDIARAKRDSVGLTDKQLQLLHADALNLNLRKKFDWVCIFFNSILGFPTLEELDKVLAGVRRHLKPSGRFFLDLFHPDHDRLSRKAEKKLEPDVFYVPELGRTVYRESSLVRDMSKQLMRITFRYKWFDQFGREKREKFTFDATCIFPRELRLLIERNGLRIEHLWGNYDGSQFNEKSPRMIARCVLA